MKAHSDTRLRRSPFGITVTIFSILFMLLLGRLFYVQIVRGADFRERAHESLVRKERIPARRGLLKDRRGAPVALNVPQFHVELTPRSFKKKRPPYDEVERLARLLSLTNAEKQTLYADIDEALADEQRADPVRLRRELHGNICPYDGSQLSRKGVKPITLSFCPQCGTYHHPVHVGTHTCHCRKKRKIVVTAEDGHAHCSSPSTYLPARSNYLH